MVSERRKLEHGPRHHVASGQHERSGAAQSTNALPMSLLRAGNRATTAFVQRLAISEEPVDASSLSRVTKLTGGHKGFVFRFQSATEEDLVVKLQNEAAKEALVGTDILSMAGATTPRVRIAEPADITNLSQAAARLEKDADAQKFADMAAAPEYPVRLLMEFAQGKPLSKLLAQDLDTLFNALKDHRFAEGFGRILAADALSGNVDRAFSGKIGFDSAQQGWIHADNFFVTAVADGFGITAIDNTFAPKIHFWHKSQKSLTGRYLGNMGVQTGSLAPTQAAAFEVEAKLIYIRILREIGNSLKRQSIVDGKARLKEAKGGADAFAKAAVGGAEAAWDQLLKRQGGLKGKATAGGAAPVELEMFRQRKRLIRLLRANVEVEEAHLIAADQKRYRTWVLVHEKGLPPEQAAIVSSYTTTYKGLVRS